MAKSVPVDAGFLVALLRKRDSNHFGAKSEATKHPPPWKTCEAALSEAFFLLGTRGSPALAALLRREALSCGFNLANDFQAGHALIDKYANVPMSLADACLVRMTETLPNAILITTDSDFQIYRRYSRRAIPAVLPK